ncbi:hypothetical protein HMPREF1982_02586 [Clostridiales bacterium oral taxon 876 str. F0540]|nr:hypothetical protein HMPREF1982_02586 [Clostridiales bacterium oral taxon 876 str. F0540]
MKFHRSFLLLNKNITKVFAKQKWKKLKGKQGYYYKYKENS